MKHNALIAVFFLVGGCSSTQPNYPTIPDAMPEWFQEALESEATIDFTSKLEVADLNVDDEVLGNFKLADQGEDYWYFISEFEELAVVECYVYTDFDGAANTLYRVIDLELEHISEVYEQDITSRNNFGLDIGVIGSTPYIALNTLYSIGLEEEQRTGLIKAIGARTNQSLQICIHNEIGFRDTFNSLAESFINAIAKSETSDAFYEAVYKLSINKLPVGFAKERYAFDEDGDVFTRIDRSYAIPVDESSISRSDTSATEWSFADGSLINANSYSVENDEVKSNLSLAATDNGWSVEGQLQGKEVNETLPHDDWILSSYGSYLASHDLLGSESSSQEYDMWIAEADPGAVTQVTMNKITDIPTANIELDMGPVKMKFYFDENGVAQQGTSSQGNISFDLDIMHVNGAPLQQ